MCHLSKDRPQIGSSTSVAYGIGTIAKLKWLIWTSDWMLYCTVQ